MGPTSLKTSPLLGVPLYEEKSTCPLLCMKNVKKENKMISRVWVTSLIFPRRPPLQSDIEPSKVVYILGVGGWSSL
jgi:hypothetical protein